MVEVIERTIRVFLVDDHRATLWGLEQLINATPSMQLAGSATCVAELLASPASLEADVIVIDLDLGGQDSSESFAEVLRTHGAKVLVLTGSRDLDSHRRAVLAGARGVVRKEEPVDVLLRAIEKVHEGDVWVNRALIGDIMSMLSGTRQAAPSPDDARVATLTPKEIEVITAVIRHKGAKSLVIADDLRISEHTLRNHLTTIYHKLEVHGRLELYVFAKERRIGAEAHS
ncbi:response regulator transcription factor [Aromatoleum toluclasticum]|uniref:response regulator transcription factor n=1 Tax=Aromatoleum toluclasticum TaxID=92003 RepID=UPI001D187251|nr:response regulator transcription factor [Aromatoleum toluclasticum]MCC4115627.1 response regulator transcription factor [Aromatoleum toluclasticum]